MGLGHSLVPGCGSVTAALQVALLGGMGLRQGGISSTSSVTTPLDAIRSRGVGPGCRGVPGCGGITATLQATLFPAHNGRLGLHQHRDQHKGPHDQSGYHDGHGNHDALGTNQLG
jgi:hypothetical protein